MGDTAKSGFFCFFVDPWMLYASTVARGAHRNGQLILRGT